MVGVLSTQLWYYQYLESALIIPPLPAEKASVLLGDPVPTRSASTLYDPKPC
jgi:hypothetical protein